MSYKNNFFDKISLKKKFGVYNKKDKIQYIMEKGEGGRNMNYEIKP